MASDVPVASYRAAAMSGAGAPPTMLPSAVFLAGSVAAILVAVELWLASFVLGARFQRLDAAEEGILS